MSVHIEDHSPESIVYQVRQILEVKISWNRVERRQADFLLEKMFPVMDEFLNLCEAMHEERENNELSQVMNEQSQSQMQNALLK